MNIFPSRDAFLSLCTQGNLIPVYTDLMADFETPVSAYAKLKQAGPSYLLESVEGGEHLSRYSFIGCRPRKVFRCGLRTTEIRQPGRPVEKIPTPADPLTLIEAEMHGYQPVVLPGLPRFTGGAVGFIGYYYYISSVGELVVIQFSFFGHELLNGCKYYSAGSYFEEFF